MNFNLKHNKIHLFLIFGLTINCSSSADKVRMSNQSIDFQNRKYVDYYDGEILNSLEFSDSNYTYTNGEMENIEKGKVFSFNAIKRQVLIKRNIIIEISGLQKKDSTYFLLFFPTDTTLIYLKRIKFNGGTGNYDTLNLDPYPMYLKR